MYRSGLLLIVILSSLSLLAVFNPQYTQAQALIADHNSCGQFPLIPLSVVDQIALDYHIYYVHTSHGSQIMTGIDLVYEENTQYDPPPISEVGSDLGHNGDTSWAAPTRSYLAGHPECNMVMYSWCGGCSDNTEEGINIYLSKMTELENAYPTVKFIYMTGHLDGSGVDGILYQCNNQIRAYCSAYGKTLFDFADIESYDPEGNYYPDETDYCNWCTDWCAQHTCPECGCAHSQCFNCYQKGKAWWWMMARLSGWNISVEDSCGDVNGDALINVSDAVWIINYVFAGGGAPDPLWTGDTNCDSSVNVSDAVWIINNVFVGGHSPCDTNGDGTPDCGE